MTFELLTKLIIDNNIPRDVELMSDSGWEGGETDMDGVWYARDLNRITFKQGCKYVKGYDGQYEHADYICLYNEDEGVNYAETESK